jgi:hypothetical protein
VIIVINIITAERISTTITSTSTEEVFIKVLVQIVGQILKQHRSVDISSACPRSKRFSIDHTRQLDYQADRRIIAQKRG